MTKPTKWLWAQRRFRSAWAFAQSDQSLRSAKIQISLGIRPVWSESSLCAQWVAKDPSFLHADSEGSDQTGRSIRWAHTHFVISRLLSLCRKLNSLPSALQNVLKSTFVFVQWVRHCLPTGRRRKKVSYYCSVNVTAKTSVVTVVSILRRMIL